MNTTSNALTTRLLDGAIAMRNVATIIKKLSVLVARDSTGILHGTLDQELCVARLRHEANQNDAVRKAVWKETKDDHK